MAFLGASTPERTSSSNCSRSDSVIRFFLFINKAQTDLHAREDSAYTHHSAISPSRTVAFHAAGISQKPSFDNLPSRLLVPLAVPNTATRFLSTKNCSPRIL